MESSPADKATAPSDEAVKAGSCDLLYHLLKFSDRTVFVVSNDQQHLVELQRSCLHNAPDGLRMMVLSGAEITTPLALMDELCRRFGVVNDARATFEQQTALLQQKLAEMPHRPALVVVEADTWDSGIFGVLFKTLEVSGKPLLRCLVFATKAVNRTLQQPTLRQYVNKRCHLLKLERMQNTASARQAPKMQGDHAVERDHEQQGTLASNLLALDKRIKDIPFHWVLAGGVVFLLCLLIALQVFLTTGHEPITETLAIPQERLAVESRRYHPDELVYPDRFAEEEATLASKDQAEDSLTPPPAITEEEYIAPRVVTPVAKIVPPEQPAVQHKVAEAAPVKVAPEAKPVIAEAAPVKAVPAKPAQVAVSEPAKVPAKADLAKIAKALSPMEKYVLSMDGTRYTIQLVAGGNEAAVKHFLAKHPMRDTRYVNLHREGKDWFVVYHGNYPSREAAKAAIAKLPKSLQQMKPWSRPIAEIQATLEARNKAKG